MRHHVELMYDHKKSNYTFSLFCLQIISNFMSEYATDQIKSVKARYEHPNSEQEIKTAEKEAPSISHQIKKAIQEIKPQCLKCREKDDKLDKAETWELYARALITQLKEDVKLLKDKQAKLKEILDDCSNQGKAQ